MLQKVEETLANVLAFFAKIQPVQYSIYF